MSNDKGSLEERVRALELWRDQCMALGTTSPDYLVPMSRAQLASIEKHQTRMEFVLNSIRERQLEMNDRVVPMGSDMRAIKSEVNRLRLDVAQIIRAIQKGAGSSR